MFIVSFLCFGTSQLAAMNEQPKAVWYRYYDHKGIATISSSVTPAHMQHGYEALDRNMQVIQRNPAWQAEQDSHRSEIRAARARQAEQDTRLRQAYSNSNVAENKRNEQLQSIKKQIMLQQQQLKRLQNDRILFKRQEMEFYRKGNAVPAHLKERLRYNEQNTLNTKNTIQSLQTSYRNTQLQYDTIIKRLKALE
ncbi:hypothetical protein [Acinetobacter sp. WZC-1]|uniref:hypothetical protein n=1 Tax=Acinetobacter sp. WZC-1 TaxID=3459034 RepID=UPI00403DDF19